MPSDPAGSLFQTSAARPIASDPIEWVVVLLFVSFRTYNKSRKSFPTARRRQSPFSSFSFRYDSIASLQEVVRRAKDVSVDFACKAVLQLKLYEAASRRDDSPEIKEKSGKETRIFFDHYKKVLHFGGDKIMDFVKTVSEVDEWDEFVVAMKKGFGLGRRTQLTDGRAAAPVQRPYGGSIRDRLCGSGSLFDSYLHFNFTYPIGSVVKSEEPNRGIRGGCAYNYDGRDWFDSLNIGQNDGQRRPSSGGRDHGTERRRRNSGTGGHQSKAGKTRAADENEGNEE
jgi:hypothetical protein